MAETMSTIGLYLTYLLLLVAVVSMVAFPLIYSIKHPKGATKSLLGIGAIFALFAICYAFSSSEVLPEYSKYGVGSNEVKLIGASLRTLYVLGIGGILFAIYAEVSKFLK